MFHAADDDISSPTDACWSHSYYHGGFGIGNRAHHTVWVQRGGQLTHPATREPGIGILPVLQPAAQDAHVFRPICLPK